MNEKIKETLDELLSAESICAPLKAAAEKAKEAAGTASEKLATAELVEELKKDVNPIGDSLAFFKSDMGKKVFGDKLEGMIKSFEDAAAAGEDTCLCPACQAGKKLLGLLKK